MKGFHVVGTITQVESIAAGRAIREIRRLRKSYGPGRWGKRKGVATVRLADDRMYRAELHCYEAHGFGKKEMKIKRFLD